MGYPSGPGLSGVQAPVTQDWSQGPKPRTVSVKAATASQLLFTGVGRLVACSFAEATGSARALAYVHDGTDTSGVIVAVCGVASGAGGNSNTGDPGIYFQSGLYLEIVSGSISLQATFMPYVDQLPN